jgi:hypothetical protein
MVAVRAVLLRIFLLLLVELRFGTRFVLLRFDLLFRRTRTSQFTTRRGRWQCHQTARTGTTLTATDKIFAQRLLERMTEIFTMKSIYKSTTERERERKTVDDLRRAEITYGLIIELK